MKSSSSDRGQRHDSHGRDSLDSDRFWGIVMLLILIGLTALVVWAASLDGGHVEPIDYWPMMP